MEKRVSVSIDQLKENRAIIVVYFILFLLLVVSTLVSETFLTYRNITNVLRQAVAIGLVSLGQTFVILAAGLDLSVGSVISLTSCLSAGLMLGRDSMLIPVVSLVIALALVVGFCNGLIIVKTGISPLIVTLGTMSIVQGAVLVYTDAAYGEVSPAFMFLAWGEIGSIQFPVFLLFAAGVLGILVLRRTPFGRHIYAIGGNEEVARLSGVKTEKIKIYTYMICSFSAALTGLYLASRMGMGDPLIGAPYMLDSLVPVLIGGTLLSGGKGGLVGTFAGIFILTVLSNSLNHLEISGYWQWVVEGVIILGAVSFYEKRQA
jgi:ribose transport system permease protein